MDNPDSPSNPAPPRTTLKLKGPARKAPEEIKPAPKPVTKSGSKPGAHWSDEYKRQMQADMDELTSK